MTVIVRREDGREVPLRLLRTLWSDDTAWKGTYREPLPNGGYLIHRVELPRGAYDEIEVGGGAAWTS